ncbi:MAG: hypothetical protein JXQ73_23860 [Phycisphaerae bacterium]|nr:hypothetical protein [Phycisphaerae bacterium]
MSRRTKWIVWILCVCVVGCMPAPTGPSGPVDGAVVTGDGVVLSGTIHAPRTIAGAPTPTIDEGYMIVAQSDETGEIYRAVTDANGEFALDIPATEAGNTFMVTILGPDGKAVGPVMYAQADGHGLTGLALDQDTSLGTVNLPDDPTAEPIRPGDDVDLSGQVDDAIVTRLNDDGTPVGLDSFGKGDDAKEPGGASGQGIDADQDGLIDMLDADDNGDGIVDDFEGDGDAGGMPEQIRAGFFMNLKIHPERAPIYYAGDAGEINAALATDTVITLEVMAEPSSGLTIAAARILETPGPAYIPTASKVVEVADGLDYVPWADSNYALDNSGDRFQAFIVPNTVMAAGDTFTAEITLSDGTTLQYSRMINYVFKNIPRLVQYGSPSNLTAFDVTDEAINGSQQQPIPLDGTQDLVLVFNPPKDELGAYIENMDYSFTIFYEGAGGQQLNDDIDYTATWPTSPAGFDRGTYWVTKDQLTLSVDDTYTFTLPKEVFPDTVATASGNVAVARYKIDITAETSSGNAAIMLTFEKP